MAKKSEKVDVERLSAHITLAKCLGVPDPSSFTSNLLVMISIAISHGVQLPSLFSTRTKFSGLEDEDGAQA